MNKKSKLGYSKGSPYRGLPQIDINTPEGLIDMSNTDIPLFAVDNTGIAKILPPYSGMHKFRGNKVTEYKMQVGGIAQAEAIAGPDMININDSLKIKSGKYPKEKIVNIIKASKAIGINPYDAVALALQENGFSTFKNKTTEESRGRRNRQALGSVGNVGFDDKDYDEISKLSANGLDLQSVTLAKALQKKMMYAKSLGYNDPAMQLQAYNGYGKITKEMFGGADKAYGVPIGDGIDMKKNPLYGKRLLQLRNDLMNDKNISSLFLQKGGYSGNSGFDFLFDDEEDETPDSKTDVNTNTAPAISDVQQPQQDTSEYDLAMQIATEMWSNPYTQEQGQIGLLPSQKQQTPTMSELDPKVVAATSELLTKFPNLKLTSTIRSWGDKDAHPKGRAIDLAGADMNKAFQYYKDVIVPKYQFNPALNPNHGTGPHIHVGYYQKGGTFRPKY
jgi:hypothetical protein